MSSTLAFADDLSVPAQEALRDLLLDLTKAKQHLAFQYASWCIRAPSVEANIALAGMSQEELGHAGVLDGLLGDDFQHPVPGKDELVRWDRWSSSTDDFAMLETWPGMVVSCLALDASAGATIEVLKSCSYARLAQRALKMSQEEQFHILFGIETSRSFRALPGDATKGLAGLYARSLADAETRFGSGRALARLMELGLLPTTANGVRAKFLQGVAQRFHAACG